MYGLPASAMFMSSLIDPRYSLLRVGQCTATSHLGTSGVTCYWPARWANARRHILNLNIWAGVVARGGIEPPTRGFSVEDRSIADSLAASIIQLHRTSGSFNFRNMAA